MNRYPTVKPSECDTRLTLILPENWVLELNALSHACHQSRLAYIRSRLRKTMNDDLELMEKQVERHILFQDAQSIDADVPRHAEERELMRWESSY